jgi:hypothetical protein
MDGDRVMRDVPRITVSFESHRLMDPAPDEDRTRLLLKKTRLRLSDTCRAATHLHRQGGTKGPGAAQRALTGENRSIAPWRMGFNGNDSSLSEDIGDLEESLRRIESQLSDLGATIVRLRHT